MFNDDKDIIDLDSTMNWSKLDIKREIDNREIDEQTGNRYDYARGFVEDEKKEQEILLDGLTSGLNYIPAEFLIAADDVHDKQMEKLPQEEKPDVSWAYRDSAGIPSTGAPSAQRTQSAMEDPNDDLRTRTTAQINAAKLREQALARERAEAQAKAKAKLEAQANAKEKAEAEAAVQASIEARKKAREEAAAKQEAIAKANAEALRKEKEAKAAKRREEQQKAQEEMYKPASDKTVDMFSTQMLEIEYIDAIASESEQKIKATKEERVAASKKNRNAADEYDSWANGSDDEYVPKKKKAKKSSGGDYDDHHKKGSGGGSKSSSKSKKKKKEDMSFWERILYFFESKSTLDYLVMGTGVLVVAAACITLGIYSASKNTQEVIKSFVPLGENMQNLGTAGSGKLVAVADSTKLLAELEAEEEQAEEEEDLIKEYEEKEDENEGVISVTMSLTSVKKDLKIKFLNAKTKKLVGNHQFKVDIEDSKGKKYSATDDDKDGIIYLNSVEPGKTKVAMVAMPDDKTVTFSTETATITVKEKIEYKKLDVADEIKSEKQVNAAKEDTAVANVVEGELKDTVEWVESTKTKVGDVKMVPIDASKLDNVPKTSAKASFSLGKIYQAASDFLCLKAYAACENHQFGDWTTTKEPSCTEKGQRERVCSVCSEKETEDIDMKAHEYENGVCKVCGAQDPNAGPTPEPTPTPGPTPTPEPTPTPAVTPSPAACADNAHTFDEGKVTKEATCKEKGEKVYTCSKCGFTKKEEIPLSEKHTFENGKCKYCGKEDDSTTKLLYNKKPVYLDEAGTKEATLADYYAGTKTFYVGETSDTSTGKEQYKYTGWQEINGNMYFYTKDGVAVTGEQVIQGAKYNFDSTGALVKGSGTMGIDVSKWNGNINWDAVKNSGVSFVIIRCGYRGSSSGAMIEDPKFKSNIQGAQKAGLKVGIYFFSQAISDVEAVEEASMTVQLIKNYKISYPVFLDVEGSGGRGDKIDKGTRTAVIQAYCQTLKNSGYTPGVYANKTWLNEKINTGSLGGYKIWLAQYNTAPTYTGHYDMWQYSSKGKVGGIGGNTDMNISYLGY